ncbi:uncharacterized protein WM277_023268 [Molossus nigricans]
MKKKQPFHFPTVPRPPSPIPLSPAPSRRPASLHPCFLQVSTLGPQAGPPGRPPPPARFPSLTGRSPPHLGARKASSLQSCPGVSSSPCRASTPTPPSLFPVRSASLCALHPSFAPNPLSGPSLASSHLGRWLTGPSSPPSRSPLPTTSSPMGCSANCPRGPESLPLGTQTFRSFMNRAPSGYREQNTVGSSYRPPGSRSYSRFPPLPKAMKGQTGQKWGNPRLNSSVCPAGPDSLRLEPRKSAARPPRKAPASQTGLTKDRAMQCPRKVTFVSFPGDTKRGKVTGHPEELPAAPGQQREAAGARAQSLPEPCPLQLGVPESLLFSRADRIKPEEYGQPSLVPPHSRVPAPVNFSHLSLK